MFYCVLFCYIQGLSRKGIWFGINKTWILTCTLFLVFGCWSALNTKFIHKCFLEIQSFCLILILNLACYIPYLLSHTQHIEKCLWHHQVLWKRCSCLALEKSLEVLRFVNLCRTHIIVQSVKYFSVVYQIVKLQHHICTNRYISGHGFTCVASRSSVECLLCDIVFILY